MIFSNDAYSYITRRLAQTHCHIFEQLRIFPAQRNDLNPAPLPPSAWEKITRCCINVLAATIYYMFCIGFSTPVRYFFKSSLHSRCYINALAATIHYIFWLQYPGTLLFQKQFPSRMIRKMERFMPHNIRKREAFISLKYLNYFFCVCVYFKGKSTPYCLSFPSKSWTSYTLSVHIWMNMFDSYFNLQTDSVQ